MSGRWQIEAVVIEYGGMPILRHAIKKLRVDARRTQVNKRVRTITKKAVKSVRTDPSQASLKQAFSALDRAAKKRVIHEGKVNRLKSRLSLLVAKSEEGKQEKVEKPTKSGAKQKKMSNKRAK